MKIFKYIYAVLFLAISLTACSSDDNSDILEENPVKDLYKIYEFSRPDHTVEVYSVKQKLEVGYNEISIRVKNIADNSYVADAAPSWMPMMHMENMSHSGPHSVLSNSVNNTVYRGHIVFQMAGNDTEFWDLTLNYNFKGEALSETTLIDVIQSTNGLKKVQVFTGNDDVRYVLAYVNPTKPEVAVNDMQAVLYKMQDMMTFPIVENYKIILDPRMPGMGNHSSPNNQDLAYNSSTTMYDGKLSLTMTGYWMINMKLLNANGELLKGEDVTDDAPSSTLYFEIEF